MSDSPGGFDEPIADTLMGLALLALDHGVDSVIASGGPLVPFVLTQNESGERSLQRVLSGTLEDSVARAFDLLDAVARPSLAVVAYDGYVHLDGGRTDAVLVEARGLDGSTVRLAQRYAKRGAIRKRVHRVGNPALLPQS